MRRDSYAKLYALGEERMAQVAQMLRTGTSCLKMARYIRNEWGLYNDQPERALEQQLRRFKTSKGIGLVEDALKLANAQEKRSLYHKFNSKVDTMQELEALVNQQKVRIAALIAKENQMNMPFDRTKAEIATMQGLLASLTKMQFDLGLLEYRGPLLRGGQVVKAEVEIPGGGVLKLEMEQVVDTAIKLMDELEGATYEGQVVSQ